MLALINHYTEFIEYAFKTYVLTEMKKRAERQTNHTSYRHA